MSSLLRSSKFIRYFAGAARNLVVSNRLSPETSLTQKIPSASALYLRSLATQATNSTNQYSSNLEKSLHQLDQDVRRVGRISRKELEDVLEEIKQSRNATSSQSLLVIRCCGSLVPEELPEVRTRLVQEIWSTLEKLKVPMDISHYNALLRVYLENEHNFSPAEFLQDLEKKGVEPNRVTYQRLITRYCQQGDIEGATRILEFMREKSLPVNENVFNALIMGHSQAEDMESATGILSVMKQAGLDPGAETYTTLLVGFAKRGEMGKVQQILADCDRNEIYLLDKDHLDIVFALATNGYADQVDEILSRLRKSAGFNQDAVNLILRLVNLGQENVALKVLRMMPQPQREDSSFSANQGFFFIRQLVKADRPVESIIAICQSLESEGLNSRAMLIATESSLAEGKVDTALRLLKAVQESGAPIRQHYFWPLLCSAGQTRDDNKIGEILQQMQESFGFNPSGETIREFVIPNLAMSDQDHIVGFLKRIGVSSGTTVSSLVFEYLQNGAIAEAAQVASKYRAFYSPLLLRRPLNIALLRTQATEHYLNLIHYMYEGMDRVAVFGEDNDGGPIEQKEVVGSILRDLITHGKDKTFDLTAILQGLLQRGLGISAQAADAIQSKLSGERLTNEISELLTKLTSEELRVTPAVRNKIPASAFIYDEAGLKERIEKVEGSGHSAAMIKRNLLGMHCKNQEVDKAIEVLKSLGQEAGPGVYAQVIESLTAEGRLDEALDFFNQLKIAYPDASLDPLKVLRLVEALYKQGRVDDGVKLLEENKLERKYDEVPFTLKAAAFQSLNVLAENGDVSNLEKTFDLLVKHNFIEVTNVILGPLVKVHVLKNDMVTAIAKLEECVDRYKMTPWKNELTKKLIEAEDAVSLQRVTDISTKVHGEVNSLYDLVFCFVECGRIRQARKILETPGLRSRQQRLNLVSERYQQVGSVSALEGLIEVTRDMSHIDRSDIFHQLLATHIKNDDPEKALGVWTQMQEEDVQPNDAFLLKLAQFLESKGMAVPFVKPTATEVSRVKTGSKQAVAASKNVSSSPALISFKNALKLNDWERAKAIKEDIEKNSVAIPYGDLSLLLEGLCQSKQIEEAHKVAVGILKSGGKIVIKHFRFFTNKLTLAGEVDKLKEIGELINADTKKAVSFDNKLCGAHFNAGRAAEHLDSLLAEVESAKPEDLPRLEEKFPRGALAGIVESNPELLPKFEQLVEKYNALGMRSPANALWISMFLTPDFQARADKMWEKYSLQDLKRPMFQRILTRARDTLDVSLLDRLVARLQDSALSERTFGVIHSCVIDVLITKGREDEALDRLNKILQNNMTIENLNSNSLQKLQLTLQHKGKTFPYTIPNKDSIPYYGTKISPRPFFAENFPVESNITAPDFFTSLIGFDGSCLRKPDKANWKTFLKDDSGILSKVPFNRQCILKIVSVDNSKEENEKTNNSNLTSSSSDDESEEENARK